MDEIRHLLERQAAWQRSRGDLTWAEKIRIAEMMREALLELRRSKPVRARGESSEE